MSHPSRLLRLNKSVRSIHTSRKFLDDKKNGSPFNTSELRDTLNHASDRLKLWAELNRAALLQRTQVFSTNASKNLHVVGDKLNTVTGYKEIEALKKRVVEIGKPSCSESAYLSSDGYYSIEQRIAEHKQAAKDAKLAYEGAVAERSSGQREDHTRRN